MSRDHLRRSLLACASLLCLALPWALLSAQSSAQGFDPAKVDWEKLSKIPMQDGFIRQFNDQCGACHGEDLRGTSLGKPLVGVDLRSRQLRPGHCPEHCRRVSGQGDAGLVCNAQREPDLEPGAVRRGTAAGHDDPRQARRDRR